MDAREKFYLGRVFDPQKKLTLDTPLLYEVDDLTTHAVVVGMTGSGKTGLCIDMLEEAALNNIPALMVDPKGDITNALLHFPELRPEDFKPWVNPDEARRAGQTLDEAAAAAASLWQKGLSDWGIGPERLRALKEAAHFAVYTPGSDSGIPISILASLQAPQIPWESNREMLREKIASTVTALLGLVGLQDVDPVRSREHILLSTIFEHAWSQGKDMELGELIMQIQNPPFSKLGVMDVNAFFPEKDRFGLSMMLNNILASPSFQSWIEGQPLDTYSLLYGPDGRPRHSVFYIAHLNDTERMFFVTLLFSTVETWMRSQSGTSTLRAILYFDEIFGYLPPISNPPSKQPLLRMLKQARAFGLGLVLVTQNPVDIDYKGLSNAGTWFIGKLQTDQDKQRLLDGLQGAMAGGFDRATYDRLISSLGKRVFLLHNVHSSPSSAGLLFQTRWAMNYLTGPLTRAQIPALNQLVGATKPVAAVTPPASEARDLSELQPIPTTRPAVAAPPQKPAPQPVVSGKEAYLMSSTRPALPTNVEEYFLPNNLTLSQAFKAAGKTYTADVQSQGLVYRPVILAQASIRFFNRKYNLDYELYRAAIVSNPDRRGVVRWENFLAKPVDPRHLDDRPDPQARFSTLEAPFSDAKIIAAMEKDFLEWLLRTTQVSVHANEALKVYAGPDVSQAEFRQECSEAARASRDADLRKVSDTWDRKLAVLKEKLAREERELAADQTELSQRKIEELGTAAETVFGLLGKRRSSRRLSTSLTKRRLTAQAKADVEESLQVIEELRKQIAALEKEKAVAVEEVQKRWGEVANQITEIPITPLRKDVSLDLFGVAWFPYYLLKLGDQMLELPGYGED